MKVTDSDVSLPHHRSKLFLKPEWYKVCTCNRAMYEIQQLAAAVAQDLLSADYDDVQPESRLFQDLQALATDALCVVDQLQIGPVRVN
jgi:hypothetical protein